MLTPASQPPVVIVAGDLGGRVNNIRIPGRTLIWVHALIRNLIDLIAELKIEQLSSWLSRAKTLYLSAALYLKGPSVPRSGTLTTSRALLPAADIFSSCGLMSQVLPVPTPVIPLHFNEV